MKLWIYRHYKWKLYEVIWLALHTETQEKLVLYNALYDTPNLISDFWKKPFFVRPYWMFNDKIKINWKVSPRFTYIWNNKYEDI